MLPYIVSLVSVCALVASLHKERLLATGPPSVFRAIRLHHLFQFAAVVLSLWVAIDGDREARRIRLAHMDATATVAAATHAISIQDQYFLKLLPAASAVKNSAGFEAALLAIPSATVQNSILERASPALARQRNAAIAEFEKLQQIARTILAESAIYGDRYPSIQTAWAERTLTLKPSDLPALLSENEMSQEYARLTGESVGFSASAAKEAFSRLAK